MVRKTKINKKYLKPVFEKMIDMGWNLDDNKYSDFKETLDCHIAYMEDIVEKERAGEIEENELVWMCQFIGDFFYSLEELTKEEE